MKLDLVRIFEKNIKFNLLSNWLIVLLFFLSKNCLDEDFVLGILSTFIFFLIFSGMKEYNYETLRQIRKLTKKIFRFQKISLKKYLFFYRELVKRCSRIYKIYQKYLIIKFINFSFVIYSKKFSFYSKLLFVRIWVLNIKLPLIYSFLKILSNFSYNTIKKRNNEV